MFLPFEQVIAVISDKKRDRLSYGLFYNRKAKSISLYMGNLKVVNVPKVFFTNCEKQSEMRLDLKRANIIDWGQTLAIGQYEISIDFLLDYISDQC